MQINKNYKHWKLVEKANQILWVYFDKEKQSTNTISHEVLQELELIVTDLQENKDQFVGAVITSKKTTGFIAGADIESFKDFKDEAETKAFIEYGQKVFAELEQLKLRTVAMIDGFCLGGGLELSLACDFRVAKQSDKKDIGLPEVLIGLHPGWGGSIRLPKLIGAPKALNLILTGKAVNAKTAKKLGIIDAVVPLRQLETAAEFYALGKGKSAKQSVLTSLTNNRILRPLIANRARQAAKKMVSEEHYPAPFAVLDNWQNFGVDEYKAYEAEAASLARIARGETAQNLVRVFFLQERLKQLGKQSTFKAATVHVVGAGTMGGDIAAWCALRGLSVSLQDQNQKAIAASITRAHKLFIKKLKKPRLVQAAMDRIIPDEKGVGIGKADVIIEAIVEDLAAKQSLFAELEKNMKKDAILATNTSSIPLDEIGKALKKPEHLVGIHFFNPVSKMQLVEIIHGEKTQKKVLQKAMGFIKQIGRLPVPVTSTPGFLVNRCLMPYLIEALTLYEEGVPIETIDKAAKDFGMPMGPIELADTVGLDVCLLVAKNLADKFPLNVPKFLQDMVDAGKLGRKTNEGFYQYKNGKMQSKTNKSENKKEFPNLTERLIHRMVNECQKCINENVVEDADLCDAAMIFGTGFAPFRGGPMHYLTTLGPELYLEINKRLIDEYGARFVISDEENHDIPKSAASA